MSDKQTSQQTDFANQWINKQVALNALEEIDCSDGVGLSALKCDVVDDAMATIKALSSEQLEIIRCRECKHMQEDKIFHQCWCNGNEVKPDHFCGYAERKDDE